jgi:hypothetical protein
MHSQTVKQYKSVYLLKEGNKRYWYADISKQKKAGAGLSKIIVKLKLDLS